MLNDTPPDEMLAAIRVIAAGNALSVDRAEEMPLV